MFSINIDHGHHSNLPQRALWEAIEFDRAVQMADDLSNDQDTLIVVTADHGHVMTFSGYPTRGNDIMGIAGIADDNLPYATLMYDNGPGFVPFENNTRYNISKDDLDSIDNTRKPMIKLEWETHGGQDVQILTKGPFAHLLTGIHEQNYIPIAMAYALCVGDGPTYCKDNGLHYNHGGGAGVHAYKET